MSDHIGRLERRSAARILAVPTLLAILTLMGLIAGLLGDGINDAIAWVGIGLPVFVTLFFWSRKSRI